jgi:hypothetical protein
MDDLAAHYLAAVHSRPLAAGFEVHQTGAETDEAAAA